MRNTRRTRRGPQIASARAVVTAENLTADWADFRAKLTADVVHTFLIFSETLTIKETQLSNEELDAFGKLYKQVAEQIEDGYIPRPVKGFLKQQIELIANGVREYHVQDPGLPAREHRVRHAGHQSPGRSRQSPGIGAGGGRDQALKRMKRVRLDGHEHGAGCSTWAMRSRPRSAIRGRAGRGTSWSVTDPVQFFLLSTRKRTLKCTLAQA